MKINANAIMCDKCSRYTLSNDSLEENRIKNQFFSFNECIECGKDICNICSISKTNIEERFGIKLNGEDFFICEDCFKKKLEKVFENE